MNKLEEHLIKIENNLGGYDTKPKDLGQHLEYIESLMGGGSGEGKIDDIKVNGTSVVENKVADIKLKTVEGVSIEGEGNISIPTYSPFNPNWRTDSITHLLADVNADPDAVKGRSYMGEVVRVTAAEGLFNGNAEICINVMNQSGSSKVIWCIVSSNNVSPYHWEATFMGGNISAKGWTGYQPLIKYNEITVDFYEADGETTGGHRFTATLSDNNFELFLQLANQQLPGYEITRENWSSLVPTLANNSLELFVTLLQGLVQLSTNNFATDYDGITTAFAVYSLAGFHFLPDNTTLNKIYQTNILPITNKF